jgi:hypothetical protein
MGSPCCLYACISLLTMLRNDSVKTFPRQRIHAIEDILDTMLSVRSVSYEIIFSERKVGELVRVSQCVRARACVCGRRNDLVSECPLELPQ